MDADLLSALAGALLSLLFAYVPGLSGWFDALGQQSGDGGTRKRLVMLGCLAVVALGVYAAACLGWWPALAGDQGPACDAGGALALLRSFSLALVANQAAFLIEPKLSGRSGLS